MKRDERWQDPQGECWQVEEVGRIKPHNDQKRSRVAFLRFRHISGVSAKVMAYDLDNWSRVAKDPLEGRRNELSKAINHDGLKVVVFPETGDCPVQKGEIYHLAGGNILIDRVSRKIIKGRPAEWHVEFIRHTKDRDYFLRSTVPGAKPNELVKPPTKDDIERARIDGNYTHVHERGGDELPAVPPDWEDKGREQREKRRREERAEEVARRRETSVHGQLRGVLRELSVENKLALLADLEEKINEKQTLHDAA